MVRDTDAKIITLYTPTQRFQNLLRAKLSGLEAQSEEFDFITENVDWQRICHVNIEREELVNIVTASMQEGEQIMGCFLNPNSGAYLDTMLNLEDFLMSQGPRPLAIYGMDQLPTKKESFPNPIISLSGKWYGVDDYKKQLS